MAANVPKNLLARHRCVTNQGTTKHECLRMLHNKTVQFNTTDDDATTPSSITTSMHDMHDTSTAGTPTPTDPDLDE
jgi:hypothetical protein